MAIQTPQTNPTGQQQQNWAEVRPQENRAQVDWRSHNRDVGVPFWGILLILIGMIALLGNFGLSLGWIFGLAIGSWFVYLGVRHVPEGQQANWWLVGIGLLIGLGSISTGFADKLVFPVVLIVVGLGILGQQYLRRPGA